MKLAKRLSLVFVLFITLTNAAFGINEIIVRAPDIHLSKPGYIDKATLVIEPLGGYSEESLYLEYSDHGQFSPGQKIEIIHRFELPQGAVVNDMWLWIGDSVMKAVCMDTWKTKPVYDSTAGMKGTPAFLTKKGNQYELHIYPLEPGKFRKIKLNFITPAQWIGKTAVTELPLLMLKSNNNTLKPLEILFRTKQDMWGEARISESPDQTFKFLKDTAGYEYKLLNLTDISQFNSLKLTNSINMQNGFYSDLNKGTDSLTYFQASFHFGDAFGLSIDSTSKKNLIGIDLSGDNYKNFSTLIPNLKKLLKASLKANDYFKIIVSGSGKTRKLSSDWIPAAPANIDNSLDKFEHSTFADSITQSRFLNLTFCDSNASKCWKFSGIVSSANVEVFENMYAASDNFSKTDIIASYDHGLERVPSPTELSKILACLDAFFLKGGRFLTYFDFNRNHAEQVASHYINGLNAKSYNHNSMTLYRNINGNIGSDFPDSIDHTETYILKYSDPDVKVELQDNDGNPVIISKRIGKGLIVVSGLWSFNDDATQKRLLELPIMGLKHSFVPFLVKQNLNAISTEYSKNKFDKALVISNSDSLVLEQNSYVWANAYAAQFDSSSKPVFNSVNLIDGTFGVPQSVTVGNVTYYNSGFLLKKVADYMNGIHFETHLNDWDIISSMLPAYSIPSLEQLTFHISVENELVKILDFREIKPEPQDNISPRFYIGSASGESEIKLSFEVKFIGIDSLKTCTFTIPVYHGTPQLYPIISAMLGYEKMKKILANSSFDPARIVQLALKDNLLCDYTSLLALEPNDNIHFMENPFDESNLTRLEYEPKADSSGFSVFPNPFNSQTKILVKVKSPSKVNLYIFNILGQLVKTIADGEEVNSGRYYMWDGKNSFNQTVSSGIYLTRVELKEKSTNKIQTFTRKLLLLK
ncbi:MAG: T9SS type A sorting domain-containing protein [Ignavibacteria bacterium]|nr:T9SS type A sorting domain-containing protein [Ignavibacteria bacterium]MCU7498657.1 T9SS type A sorting domain-containing protein [Ignavibacteria bacterium]MCU7512594.1 T9SS type A sorting domain-containing protein [Ignavibacteria bacterium]MCU7519207.1 T9SS type A sorting domain-containing protein [Ignavibacteria bacterium]MCU7524372.1 T9SS type A sorting domain-containing protein [Ignavibacteria bacterium]